MQYKLFLGGTEGRLHFNNVIVLEGDHDGTDGITFIPYMWDNTLEDNLKQRFNQITADANAEFEKLEGLDET